MLFIAVEEGHFYIIPEKDFIRRFRFSVEGAGP
jgi:hypothetical protein